jgi:hypothetical protein
VEKAAFQQKERETTDAENFGVGQGRRLVIRNDRVSNEGRSPRVGGRHGSMDSIRQSPQITSYPDSAGNSGTAVSCNPITGAP